MRPGQELLEASIVALVFALGLRAESAPAGERTNHWLVARVLFAREVFVPLFVMSVLSMAGVARQAILGATLLAISPGIPIVLQRELQHGRNAALVFRTTALGVLLSIVSVPFWLAIASRLFVENAAIVPLAVGRLIALLFVVPFGAGMAMRRISPRAMLRVSGPILLLADLLLLIASIVLFADIAGAVTRLGARYTTTIVGIIAFALLVGDVAAGSRVPDRRTASLLCAARHPGLALLVAQSNFGGDLVLPATMVSIVIGMLLTTPFAVWRRWRLVDASRDLTSSADAVMLAPPARR